MAPFGTLKAAGQFLFLSALLHLAAPFLSGFAPVGLFMGVVFILYSCLAMGLTRGMRWLGYIVFVFMLIGAVGGYIQMGTIPVPDWLIWAIISVDIIVIVNLFAALWSVKPAQTA